MRAATRLLLGLLFAAGAAAGAAAGDDPKDAKPVPPEPTVERLHGLRVDMVVPKAKPEAGYSFLVFFHGRSQAGKEFAVKLAPFADRGFIVACPSSSKADWIVPEMEAVKSIAKELCEKYEVPREKRHVAGMWTGTEGVPLVAFDEELGCRTATWIDGGWGGGSVAKWAKDELSGLFLWGPREGPSRAENFRKASSLLADRVKSSLARGDEPEPGLGRGRKEDPEFPLKLLPFWGYFMESMEGRFAAGYDLSSDWKDDLEKGKADMAEKKAGGFVYVYAAKPEKDEWERTRALQNEVLLDRTVRHFADQLVAVKIEKGKAKDLMDAAKVTETPAIIVYKKGGKEILKSIGGEISAKALVPLLRAVAADQDIPK